MKLTLAIIFMIYFIMKLAKPCKQGCLSCDFKTTTFKCSLCDYDNFYVPVDSQMEHESFINQMRQNITTESKIRRKGNRLLEISQIGDSGSVTTDQGSDSGTGQGASDEKRRLCVKIEIPRCQKIGFRFEQIVCLECETGFWFSPSVRSCVEVDSEMGGCLYYAGKTTCQKCQNGYYLDQDGYICRKSDFAAFGFEKCVEMDFNGECVKCADNYYLDWEVKIDSKKVLRCATKEQLWGLNETQDTDSSILEILNLSNQVNDLPVFDPHCVTHSQFTCQQCDDKHRTIAPIQQKLAEELRIDALIKITKYELISEKICYVKKIAFCERYLYISENEKFCDKCEPGYYLDLETRNKCLKNPVEPIDHCWIYSSETVCKECVKGYEKLGDALCHPQILQEDCLEINNNGLCQKCKNNMLLDQDKNICFQRNDNLEHCKVHSRYVEGCLKCEDGYFMYDDEETMKEDLMNYYDTEFYKDDWEVKLETEPSPFELKTCYPIPNYPIENCQTHLIFSRGCEVCVEGYFLSLDKTTCLYTIPHCANTMTNMNDTNGPSSCFECEVGYAPSGDNRVCVENKIAHCKVHNQREASCIHCEMGYYFKLDDHPNFPSPIRTVCEPFPDPNCYINEESTEMCLECKKNYYKQIPESTKLATLCVKKNEMFDERCQAHDSLNDDRMCSTCADDHAQIHIQTFGIDEIERSGCLMFDYHKLTCRECKTNYGTLNDGMCNEFDDSSICKKLLPFRNSLDYEEGLLKDNKRCQRCRDPELYYLSESKQCILRDQNKYQFCLEKYHDKDVCKKCDNGLAFSRGIDVATCQNEPKNFQKIEHCLIYSYPDKIFCLYCEQNYVVQNSKCVLNPNEFILFWLKPGMKMTPYLKKSDLNFTILNKNLPGNCGRWVQINNSEIECVNCKEGYVGVLLDSNGSSRSNKHGLNPFSGNFEPQAVFYSVRECESDMTNFLGYAESSTPEQFILDGKCLFAKDVGDKLICLTCKSGYVSKLRNMSYTNSEGKFWNFDMVIDCVNATEMENQYLGYGLDRLAYKSQTYNGYSHANYSHLMTFDSCKNNDYALVYLSKSVPSESHLNFKCLDTKLLTSEISNCQIYNWDSTDPLSMDARNDTRWKCIACKPGSRPFFGPRPGFQIDSLLSCDVIPKCNLGSPENLWMNACAVPDSGYGHVIRPINLSDSNSAQHDLFLHQPLRNQNNFENCLIFSENSNSSLSKCLLCKSGYYSNIQTKCLPISTKNCEKQTSHLSNYFQQYDLRYLNQIRSLYSLKHVSSPNESNLVNQGFGCSKCKPGYLLTLARSDEDFICESYSFYTSVEHCTAYGGSNRNCTECESGYIITSSNDCAPAKKHPFCAHLGISFDQNNHQIFYTCTHCIEGYYLSEIKSCHPKNTNHCMIDIENEQDVHICPICLPGYKLSPGPNRMCVLNNDLADPCVIYNSDDFCLRCKEPTHIPLNYNFKDTSFNFVICVEADFSFNWAPIKHNLFIIQELEEHFMALAHAANGMFFVDEKKISSDFSVFPDLPQTVCLKLRDSSKCAEFHKDSRFLCTKCNDGHYLINFQCLAGTTANCKQYYSDQNRCSVCQDGFYLNHAHSCRNNHIDANCTNQKYDPNNGKCLECGEGYSPEEYFNHGEVAIRCNAFDNTKNCQQFDPKDGLCLTCLDGYHYLYSSKKCHSKSKIASNCEFIDEYSLVCSQCYQGYFRSGYDTCSPRPNVDLCIRYSLGTGRCMQCKEGYFIKLVGNKYKCLANPNGLPHCKEYLDPNRCSKCEDAYMVDPKTFKCFLNRILVSNCGKYVDDLECSHCDQGFILRFNFCFEIENTNCSEWLDEKNCRTCPPDRVLTNEGGFWDCPEPLFKNCLVVERPQYNFEYRYTSRIHGDPDLMLALDNTMYYHLTTHFYKLENAKCQQCDQGMFFDPEQKECVQLPESDQIPGCKLYTNEKKCGICTSDFYLDQKTQICENLRPVQNGNSWRDMIPAFQDCEVMNKWKTPQCVRCDTGYYLDLSKYNYINYEDPNTLKDTIDRPGYKAREFENIRSLNKEFRLCKPCSMNGCGVCLPKNPHKCVVCKSGFYMIQDENGHTRCEINYEVQGFSKKQIGDRYGHAIHYHALVIFSAIHLFWKD